MKFFNNSLKSFENFVLPLITNELHANNIVLGTTVMEFYRKSINLNMGNGRDKIK